MSKEKFICSHPWSHFEVNNPNGDVTMCCDNGTVLGNVNEGSIREIWNGDGFRNMRRRMRDEGAQTFCPQSCPVLNGYKNFQNLDWYGNMPADSAARANAAKNDAEYEDGKLTLESLPRWMRFAYSYACNLDCYHCYQRDDAVAKTKLPESFLDQVRELSPYYQVIYYFGGEPFLYRPILSMMDEIKVDPACRFHYVTNATLLTDNIISVLERANIGHFAVSLDAATEKSFDILRRKDAKTSWDAVLENVRKLSSLKAKKNFTFSISMTLNSINHDEIESFVDLGLEVGAEPLIMLVANPYQTLEFQRKFLNFKASEFRIMGRQIENSLAKVRAAGLTETEKALENLARVLDIHQKLENRRFRFLLLKNLRFLFRLLPKPLQHPLRKMFYLPLRSLIGRTEF